MITWRAVHEAVILTGGMFIVGGLGAPLMMVQPNGAAIATIFCVLGVYAVGRSVVALRGNADSLNEEAPGGVSPWVLAVVAVFVGLGVFVIAWVRDVQASLLGIGVLAGLVVVVVGFIVWAVRWSRVAPG